MATCMKDRQPSYPRSATRNGNKTGQDSPAAGAESIEVQWTEIRISRDGGRERFFLSGTRTSAGWRFQERATSEVSWFPVAPALQDRCTKRALEVLPETTASAPPTHRRPPEVRPDFAVFRVRRQQSDRQPVRPSRFAAGRRGNARPLCRSLRWQVCHVTVPLHAKPVVDLHEEDLITGAHGLGDRGASAGLCAVRTPMPGVPDGTTGEPSHNRLLYISGLM